MIEIVDAKFLISAANVAGAIESDEQNEVAKAHCLTHSPTIKAWLKSPLHLEKLDLSTILMLRFLIERVRRKVLRNLLICLVLDMQKLPNLSSMIGKKTLQIL